jgi:hypothetical protein
MLDHLGLMPAERGIAEDLVENSQCLVIQCRTYIYDMRK